MKINNNISKILSVYNKQQIKSNKKQDNKTNSLNFKDELSISNEAKEIQQLMKKLKDIPDVREEKINEIKERIKSGTYEINPEKIAEKMLNRLKY